MLALKMFIKLLVGVAFPVVQVFFIVFVPKVLAEYQILIKIIKQSTNFEIRFERGFGHVLSLLNVDRKVRMVSFISNQAAVLTIFGYFYPHCSTWIAVCYCYI